MKISTTKRTSLGLSSWLHWDLSILWLLLTATSANTTSTQRPVTPGAPALHHPMPPPRSWSKGPPRILPGLSRSQRLGRAGGLDRYYRCNFIYRCVVYFWIEHMIELNENWILIPDLDLVQLFALGWKSMKNIFQIRDAQIKHWSIHKLQIDWTGRFHCAEKSYRISEPNNTPNQCRDE